MSRRWDMGRKVERAEAHSADDEKNRGEYVPTLHCQDDLIPPTFTSVVG